MSAPGAGLVRRSILCVQQDAQAQEFLQRALSAHRVVLAASAFEALRMLNAGSFDAYVLDYWLPDWSGLGLCRDIRKTDPHAPICFYTMAVREEYRARALRAGATAYIEGPIDGPTLARRLDSMLLAADATSLHARIEEERCIQEELARQAQAAFAHSASARERSSSAMENAARVRALRAFTAAGGTRAHFERWWRQQFDLARAARGACPDTSS